MTLDVYLQRNLRMGLVKLLDGDHDVRFSNVAVGSLGAGDKVRIESQERLPLRGGRKASLEQIIDARCPHELTAVAAKEARYG